MRIIHGNIETMSDLPQQNQDAYYIGGISCMEDYIKGSDIL